MQRHTVERSFTDILITDIINATMTDGGSIRPSVKVDTILAHLDLEHLPEEVKRLIAQGVVYRTRRSKSRG